MKKARLYFTLLVAIITGQFTVASQSAKETFFPDLVFEDSKDHNEFVVDWYTKHLIALEEPSLLKSLKDKKDHSYRFLWLRTFDRPISLRLVIDPEGTGLIAVKITDGQGGYEPGKLTVNETIPLTKQNVDHFLRQLNQSHFWKLPTREKINEKNGMVVIGTDGAQWVFEGVRDGEYHVVDRWSPQKGSYRQMALLLVRLSGIKIKNIY